MTHLIFKRALALAGAAILALPLAIGTFESNPVAADSPATPDTQNITLTKYAYTHGIGITSPDSADDMIKTPDPDQDRVAGVKFTVYNVTDQYWTGIENGTFDSSVQASEFTENKSDIVHEDTTDANGQISYPNAPTHVDFNGKQKAAVYLFVEDPSTAPDYNSASAKFILSLPVKTSDGNYPDTVYVYPKNFATDTYDLEFTKQDSETGATLANAEFQITNKAGLYAQVSNATDNKVTVFSADPVQVKWVQNTSDATTFISDNNGKFGFTSYAETVRDRATWGLKKSADYTYIETKAPNGYGKVNDGTINSQNGANDESLVVKDTPTGLLPHTGGIGIIAFITLGVALVVIGGIAYTKRRVRF